VPGQKIYYIFEELLEENKQIFGSSLEYLKEVRVEKRYPVLNPQATVSAPFMAGEPVETFVGRERDLEELHQNISFRGAGAITYMVGTEGIGKTELARMYAKRYKAEYPAGIFWVSLRGSTWREETQKIFETLYPGADITPFPDNAKAKDEICMLLKQKAALLVIDNVNEAGEIIRPDCPVLVTTRERRAFGIASRMAIKELDGLSGDDGVKLLAKILGEARVSLDLSGASRIVEILGGIPLALDIAACHLQTVPDPSFPDYIDEIQGKIEELKLKESEDKEVVASLELSLRQFENIPHGAERIAFFEAAGVCAESGFTSLTLTETAGLGVMNRGIAEELHRRSLLEFDRKSLRYSMHPLLRQLSEARLHMDESRELLYRENHCIHFLNFSQENIDSPEVLVSERNGLWQAMIQTHQTGRAKELLPSFLEYLIQPFRQLTANDDYEGAFRYLVATGLINIDNLGLVNDLAPILHVLADNQAALQEFSRAWVYTSLGSVSIQLGDYLKTIDFYEKALEIHCRIGDMRGEGNVLGNMGNIYVQLGECPRAIIFYEKQLEITRQIRDAQGEGNVLGNIGNVYTDLGKYRRAIGFYEKQLEITRLTGDAHGEGNALGNIGISYADLGKYRRAIGFYEKQLEITRLTGDAQGEGNAFCNMGIAYANLGEHFKAVTFFKKQLEMHCRIGYTVGEGNALGNMGIAYAKLGMQKEAYQCFETSKNIFHGLGQKDVTAKIEEMMRNAEYWLLRNGMYVKSALSQRPDKKKIELPNPGISKH
jgi:tetratricopeptide (TPR) repeat protein